MEDLINRIIAAKDGDKEFILSLDPMGRWFAAIGNKSEYVCIGEQLAYGNEGADFYANGTTAAEALEALAALMGVTVAA